MRRLLLVDPAGRVSLGELEGDPPDDPPTGAAAGVRSGEAGQGAQVRTAVWSAAGQWAAQVRVGEQVVNAELDR